jgi:hypothetical protein
LQNDCFDDKKEAKYNDRNEKIRQGYSDGSHSEIEVHDMKLGTLIPFLKEVISCWNLWKNVGI